jgi:hypothetical protein
MTLKVKDPDAQAPYGFDWTSYLAFLGEDITIATSAWAREGPDSDLTIASSSIVTGGLKTQAFFSGGTPGVTYTVRNRITTTSSPAVTDDRSFELLVEEQ